MFHQRVCVCLCACVLTGRWHHILCHFMTFLDDFLSCWPSAAIVIANKQHQHTTYTVMSCTALNPTLCVCLNSWTWITTSSHHLNSCSLGQSLWKNKNESPNNEDEIYIIFSFFFRRFFPPVFSDLLLFVAVAARIFLAAVLAIFLDALRSKKIARRAYRHFRCQASTPHVVGCCYFVGQLTDDCRAMARFVSVWPAKRQTANGRPLSQSQSPCVVGQIVVGRRCWRVIIALRHRCCYCSCCSSRASSYVAKK